MYPNSKTSEEALIWAMLIDDSIINLIQLSQEDFYDINLWKIYNLCRLLKENRKSVDLIVLKEYLQAKWVLDSIGWIEYLVQLIESATSTNWKDYENIIKDKSQRRDIIKYAKRMEMTANDEWKNAKGSSVWWHE